MSTTDTVARADHDAAVAAARTEGEAQGRTQAVARIRAILTSPEAKGREGQALVFALDSDMTPEVAAKALAASPAAAARPPLEERNNPPVAGGRGDQSADIGASWDRSLKRAGAKLPATN